MKAILLVLTFLSYAYLGVEKKENKCISDVPGFSSSPSLSVSFIVHHKNVMVRIEMGDCKECIKGLEKFLIKINGIESVEFVRKSKTLKIVYDPAYMSEIDIHQNIAKRGYDTELVKATDQAYNDLMDCCKYRN